jgi:hypothetical protein
MPRSQRTLLAPFALLALFSLQRCATRVAPDSFAHNSSLSPESPQRPAPTAAVSLREDPPLPDEPSDAALWRALDDPDASVFPLPAQPGESWGGAQPAANVAPTQSTGAHNHGR